MSWTFHSTSFHDANFYSRGLERVVCCCLLFPPPEVVRETGRGTASARVLAREMVCGIVLTSLACFCEATRGRPDHYWNPKVTENLQERNYNKTLSHSFSGPGLGLGLVSVCLSVYLSVSVSVCVCRSVGLCWGVVSAAVCTVSAYEIYRWHHKTLCTTAVLNSTGN